ncbi:putative WhiB transcription regulator [Corynebacterium terpenotabidum Y-11]|uniref:Transcriptional regulator WhiB n=2 Tax=Corynebacterium terpenotabidum TaxID=89154 RepID=S4XE22_9CORY|nr:putative WhiB transcription regulator [Corynebacterium terpenotabidum Y-11]
MATTDDTTDDYRDADPGIFPVPMAEGSMAVDPGRSDLTSDFDAFYEKVEQEWQEQALCAQTDPEAFFPEKGGSTREAKRICRACGVRDECLEYALAHDERFGIWGGLSERERRRLKKRLG